MTQAASALAKMVTLGLEIKDGGDSSVLSKRSFIAGAMACMVTHSLHAQSSLRTLAFVVPQPAGNPTDAIARKLLPVLQKELGQTIVVENLPGAGGSIGVNKVLTTPRNQSTLLIASQTEPILTPLALAGVRFRAEDLKAVALISRGPYVLVGRSDLPAATLDDLTALARQSTIKPLSLGHVGAGSMIHLLGEQWSRRSGATLTMVPYRGLPPIIQDLLGGQIDLSFVPLAGSTATLIESGRLRTYGTTTADQVARLPRVAPLSKLNRALGDFNYGTWAAVFTPRFTSDAEAQRLHHALSEAMKDADLQAYIAGGGTNMADPMNLAELEDFYQSEIRLYRALAREVGIAPQ